MDTLAAHNLVNIIPTANRTIILVVQVNVCEYIDSKRKKKLHAHFKQKSKEFE